jgi:palmitoyltransferase
MGSFKVASLAVPAVLTQISILSFSSQYLFKSLDPEPLTEKETIYFNVLIFVLLICYARAVLTDPGQIPKLIAEKKELGNDEDEPLIDASQDGAQQVVKRQRWCRTCESRKPPRSHHCRVCKRYISPFSDETGKFSEWWQNAELTFWC